MGIWSRLGDLLAANLHELIDRAEDPATMARQIIREVEERITATRLEVRRLETRAKRLRRDLDQRQGEVASWRARAEDAVREGDDDLARLALRKSHDLEATVGKAEEAWWSASQAVAETRETLARLEDQAQAARRRRDELVARARRDTPPEGYRILAPEDARAEDAFRDLEVERELRRLKERRDGPAS